VIATLATHPEVRALDQFRNVDLVYNGNLAVLGAGSYDVVLDNGGLLFKSPATPAMSCGARSARTPSSSPSRSRRGITSATAT
jgi:hypothetical protein